GDPSALGAAAAAPFSAHRPLDSRVARVVSPGEEQHQETRPAGRFRPGLAGRAHLPSWPAQRHVGIGVVGAGFIVRDCHLVAYAEAGFPVVGITSRTHDRAREVADARRSPTPMASTFTFLSMPRVPGRRAGTMSGAVRRVKEPVPTSASAGDSRAPTDLPRAPSAGPAGRDAYPARSITRAAAMTGHGTARGGPRPGFPTPLPAPWQGCFVPSRRAPSRTS